MYLEKEYINTREQNDRRVEIKHEEIAKLREPIKRILDVLRDKIDEGDYGLVIGDDVSGRIPAYIFDKILKTLYKENGYPGPKTCFFAGSKWLGERLSKIKSGQMADYLEGYIGHNKEIAGDKETSVGREALLVTDTISSGESIKPIADALKKIDMAFTIATIALVDIDPDETLPEKRGRLEEYLGGRIIHGQTKTPSIWGARHLAGVKKSNRNIFSTSMKEENKNNPSDSREIQNIINESAEDTKLLAEELINWYGKTGGGTH